MNKFIITVIGADRPGIIAAVSDQLFISGCNIKDISQTILQSVFGALFIVTAPAGLEAGKLQTTLTENLSSLGLEVFVRRQATAAPATIASQPFIITTFGPDRPGLVRAITRVLARHAVNVSNLKAVFKGGAQPGDNVMIFEVDVPAAVDLPVMRRELEQAARDTNLEINIQHRRIFESMNRI